MAEYINFASGFNITTTLPVDKRLVMTKAEMLAIKKPQMPDYYFVLCSDDNRLYIYDKSIVTPDPELGRFRPIENYFSFASTEAKAAIETAIINSQTIIDLTNKVGDAEAGTGIAGQVKELNTTVEELSTNVTNVTNRVDALEPKVDTLEERVGDDTKGLIKQVNTLETTLGEDLEPRVEKAEEDITVIETWINNVRLDGGEIKVEYDLTKNLTNAQDKTGVTNPTVLNYNASTDLYFEALSGYVLPETVTVSGTSVGATETDCGVIKATWIKADGKLTLSNPRADITYIIEAEEEV